MYPDAYSARGGGKDRARSTSVPGGRIVPRAGGDEGACRYAGHLGDPWVIATRDLAVVRGRLGGDGLAVPTTPLAHSVPKMRG